MSSSSRSLLTSDDKMLVSDVVSLNPFTLDGSSSSTITTTTANKTDNTIDNNELDDEIPDALTASYSEISFNNNIQMSLNDNNNDKMHKQRPDSLICEQKSNRHTVGGGGGVTFPYNLQGTVSVDGCNMTHFIAENLEYKIKLSSPVTKRDYSGGNGGVGGFGDNIGGSCITTPSAVTGPITVGSSGVLRQFFQSAHLTQIDSNVLNDIENEAQYLAASVDTLTENLCNLLHSISSITADNVETYKNAVNKLTDCMDGNIKSMYTIMAKTEEISNAMKPTEQLATRIREIKRLVDMLEGNI